MKSYSNTELIEGIKRKDNQIFSYLYRQHGPKILGYVLKNSGTEADGKEVIQKTLLKVWHNIQEDKYNEQSKLSQYISRIASNTWLEELRLRKRKPVIKLGKGEEMLKDEGEEDLVRQVYRGSAMDAMYRAMQQLGDKCRQLIELYYFEEQALKDIAEEQGVKYGALRKSIFDCRAKLKKLSLAEMGG